MLIAFAKLDLFYFGKADNLDAKYPTFVAGAIVNAGVWDTVAQGVPLFIYG